MDNALNVKKDGKLKMEHVPFQLEVDNLTQIVLNKMRQEIVLNVDNSIILLMEPVSPLDKILSVRLELVNVEQEIVLNAKTDIS